MKFKGCIRVLGMITEEEFWRLDPTAKVESVTHDIERLIPRARAAGLSAAAYILELALRRLEKDLIRAHSNAVRNHRAHDCLGSIASKTAEAVGLHALPLIPQKLT
jgi:hypothetical protein